MAYGDAANEIAGAAIDVDTGLRRLGIAVGMELLLVSVESCNDSAELRHGNDCG